MQLRQFWRDPLFGGGCGEAWCGNECTDFDFFLLFTDENGQTL